MFRQYYIGMCVTLLLSACAYAENTDTDEDIIYIAASSENGIYTTLVNQIFQQAVPRKIAEVRSVLEGSNCDTSDTEKTKALCDELKRLKSLSINQLRFNACLTGGSKQNLETLNKYGVKPEATKATDNGLRVDCLDQDQKRFSIPQNQIAFAIVQNDSAYAWNSEHQTLGIIPSKLRAVLPLFPGFIQLVQPIAKEGLDTHKGDIAYPIDLPEDWLDRTGNKRPVIAVGNESSTIPDHATNVLLEDGLSLKAYLDYEPRFISTSDCDSYKNADYLFRASDIKSAHQIREECGRNFRHLKIPDRVLTSLDKKHDYYEIVDVPQRLVNGGAPKQLLSVNTYLMTVKQTDDRLVEAVTRALVEAWPELTREAEKENLFLIPLETGLKRTPVYYHDGAEEVFFDKDLLTNTVTILGGLFFPFFAFLLIFVASYFQSTEGRMGYMASNSFIQRQADRVVNASSWIVASGVILFLLSAFIFALELVEQWSARESNTVNPFSDKDFGDALVWIFTFMVSGYEDQVYPQSIAGKILISLIALAGLILPLTGVYTVFNRVRDRKSMHARGLADYHQYHDHLVICGWNTRGTDIVWSISVGDGLNNKDVVIVTKFPENEPLKTRHFNEHVHYIRGDPTDTDTLIKAGVRNARAVILLAPPEAQQKNLGAAITSMAVRELNPDVFVIAEQSDLGNEVYLAAGGAHAIVEPEAIANGVTAATIADPLAVDFVLDVLTVDGFSEWYAITDFGAKNAPKWTKGSGPLTVARLIARAQKNGLNAIAVAEHDAEEKLIKFAPGEIDVSHINLLQDEETIKNPIGARDFLICAAYGRDEVRHGNKTKQRQQLHFGKREIHLVAHPPVQRVLLAGSKRRTETISRFLTDGYDRFELQALSLDLNEQVDLAADARFIQQSVAFKPDIIVLLGQPMGEEVLDVESADQLDERSVMMSKFLHDALGDDIKIIAELHNLTNRRLFVAAGADIIVPINLVTERFMARSVVGRGDMAATLLALIDPRADCALQSFVLTEGHPLVGVSFEEALATRYADGRVLAAIPQSMQDSLRNTQGDFGTHFLMCQRRNENIILASGDTLVVRANKR